MSHRDNVVPIRDDDDLLGVSGDGGILLPCAELDALCQQTIAELQDDIEAHNERLAIQHIDDGLTTTQRALAALQEPDTHWGRHAVARAWLRDCDPAAGIWRQS